MDDWCAWTCVIEMCPLIALFSLRRVCRSFKTKCDERMSMIPLPHSLDDDVPTFKYYDNLLQAVQACDFSMMPRCGDLELTNRIVWQRDWSGIKPLDEVLFETCLHSIGVSHDAEAIAVAMELSHGKIPYSTMDLETCHCALCSGIVSRDSELLSDEYHVVVCLINQYGTRVFHKATPKWQARMYTLGCMYHKPLYVSVATYYLTVIDEWKYETVIALWDDIMNYIPYMYIMHMRQLYKKLLDNDDTDRVFQIAQACYDGRPLQLEVYTSGGVEWPFIVATSTLFDANSVLRSILYRKNLDAELQAVKICLDRGAVLNGNDVLTYKHCGLFDMWMMTNPRLDQLEPCMYHFEDWQMIMVAVYQPQNGRHVMRHAANRGMFDVVKELFGMGVTVTPSMVALLHPPNQVITAYLIQKAREFETMDTQ